MECSRRRSPVTPARPAERPDVDPVAGEGQGSDHDLQPPREHRGRRHEPLDQTRQSEHEDEAEGDRDQGSALLGERSAARATTRVDDGPEQLQAGAACDEHGGQLQQTVRQDELEEPADPVVRGEDRARHAHCHGVVDQDERRPDPGDAERDALGGDERVVGPDLGREARPLVLGVVRRERLVRVGLELGRSADQSLCVRGLRDVDPRHDGDQDARDRGADAPPAHPVQRCGQHLDQEARDVRPRGVVRAGDCRPGPRERLREPRDQRRVRGSRAHHRQVGGHLLVQPDQLVRLGTAEPRPSAERVEPAPGALVHRGERVEVHAR